MIAWKISFPPFRTLSHCKTIELPQRQASKRVQNGGSEASEMKNIEVRHEGKYIWNNWGGRQTVVIWKAFFT